MEFAHILKDLLYITLPAGAVLYGMYLMVRSFVLRDMNRMALEIKSKNTEALLPLRLQAYERMAIFLERVTPTQLLRRLSDDDLNVIQMQQMLASEVRQEFNHNLSQQVYMSDEAWELVRSAVEETISLINRAAEGLDPDENAVHLGRRIFELSVSRNEEPTHVALRFLKNEIQQVF
ncbi:MAG: hypothetical protein ACFCUI_12805 [Bernardetiaceae bacterium]